MINIPGIISIGYAKASNYNFPGSLKANHQISVDANEFTFLDVVPETGSGTNQQKKSTAGSYFSTEVNFKLTNIDNNMLTVLESLREPHLYYIKAISGNYLMGLNSEIFPAFIYDTINENKATGFVGANCKLTLLSLMGMIEIA